MNIEVALYSSILCHMAGDYLLQNDWMAKEKTRSFFPCFVHCLLYTMCFSWVLWGSPFIWLVFITHYFVDRYRLAQYWIRLVNWNWSGDNFGYADDKPKWMSVWLLIIVDNTIHVIFNTLAITLSYSFN